MSVRISVESLSGCAWNGCPSQRGIRNQAEKVYVQDRLRQAANELKKWLADGAAIYICGSLQGMASGVDQVLNEVLGADQVERLIEQGRYRRDVY